MRQTTPNWQKVFQRKKTFFSFFLIFLVSHTSDARKKCVRQPPTEKRSPECSTDAKKIFELKPCTLGCSHAFFQISDQKFLPKT